MNLKSFYDRLHHKIIENTNPYLGGLRRRLGEAVREPNVR